MTLHKWSRISVCLFVLMLLATIGGCKTQPVSPGTHEPVKLTLFSSAFGSIAYSLGSGMETIFAKSGSWLTLSHAEGLGGTGNVNKILTDPQWKSVVAMLCNWDYPMAEIGLGPFEGKPVPDVQDKVKVLANYTIATQGFVTLNPNIKNEQDLKDKRVGVGRISQSGWGMVPKMAADAWPELNIKIDLLGPTEAVAAMLDGKVDVAMGMFSNSPDYSVVANTGAINDLLASKRDFYYVTFSTKGIDVLEKKYPFLASVEKVPAGKFPGQKEDLVWWVGYCPWCVDSSFPEDQAYEFTRLLIKHCGELPEYHALGKAVATPEALVYGWKESNFHPGALRAYKEAGVKIK